MHVFCEKLIITRIVTEEHRLHVASYLKIANVFGNRNYTEEEQQYLNEIIA